jgi:hypothetical protein
MAAGWPAETRWVGCGSLSGCGETRGYSDRWRTFGCSEFLEKEQGDEERRYCIYYASFQDFLKEQVDLIQCDDMIADYYLALAGLDEE